MKDENEERTVYFAEESLKRFVAAEGKTLSGVSCHLWQNLTDKQNPVEIIDNIQLHFGEKELLTIGCNEDGNGLDTPDFNFQEVSAAIQAEFGGRIKIFSLDASSTKMWKDVIGKKVESVQLTKDGDYYLADSVLLNFGAERRIIHISPVDGLLIDFYEE